MSKYEQIGRSIVKAGTLAAVVNFDLEATDKEVREFNAALSSHEELLDRLENLLERSRPYWSNVSENRDASLVYAVDQATASIAKYKKAA